MATIQIDKLLIAETIECRSYSKNENAIIMMLRLMGGFGRLQRTGLGTLGFKTSASSAFHEDKIPLTHYHEPAGGPNVSPSPSVTLIAFPWLS